MARKVEQITLINWIEFESAMNVAYVGWVL